MNDVVTTGTPIAAERPQTRPARGLAPVVGWVTAVVALLFTFLAILHETRGVDVRVLLRDPAETAQIPEYAGAYMYAGVLLLWTAGVVSVVAGRVPGRTLSDARMARFRVGLGIFLCWLAADDLFMIHEWLGLALSQGIGVENEYLGRTRLEGIVFLSYGTVALAGLWRYRAEVRRSGPALLATAIGCLGLSAAVDIGGSVLDGVFTTGSTGEMVRTYAEEMLKIAGILFIGAYVLISTRASLQRGAFVATVQDAHHTHVRMSDNR